MSLLVSGFREHLGSHQVVSGEYGRRPPATRAEGSFLLIGGVLMWSGESVKQQRGYASVAIRSLLLAPLRVAMMRELVDHGFIGLVCRWSRGHSRVRP